MFFVLWVRKKILYFLISGWQLCCQGELLRPDTIVESLFSWGSEESGGDYLGPGGQNPENHEYWAVIGQ